MPIHINLLRKMAVKPQPLNIRVIEDLMNSYTNIFDLGERLFKLPIIPKGRQHNSFPRTNVNAYAANKAIELSIDLYIGYFVYFHQQTQRWAMHEHVFNVDKAGKVQEHAKGIEWVGTCHYVGLQVPKNDYYNDRFASEFISSMDYINEYSSRAMFELPKPEKTDEDNIK